MRRRAFVAGLAGLTAAGAGAALLTGSPEGAVEPTAVETLDAPGSQAGRATVPERGRVTFVEFFATWCHVCAATMPALAAAHDAVDDDVQFLSLTNEPVGHAVSRAEVREWWAAHGGGWTVGLDADLEVTAALGVTGVPTAVVLDDRNVVTWSGTGRKPADRYVAEIEAAGRG